MLRPLPNSNSDTRDRRVSRRSLLLKGFLGAGICSAGVFALRPALAATKTPKAQAGYKDTAQGSQRCDKCVHFQPPASCALVDGVISPAGSCDLFAPKPG